MDHAEKQGLIGKMLAYEPPPRPSFDDWWEQVDDELAAAGLAAALYGEVSWRYRSTTLLTPAEAADQITRERFELVRQR